MMSALGHAAAKKIHKLATCSFFCKSGIPVVLMAASAYI